MKSWISLILAVIFLSAVVIFNIKRPQPVVPNGQPTPTPKSTPTPTLVPIPLSSTCNAASLSATIAFEGAAGSIYGTAKLTNIGTSSCSINLSRQLELVLPSYVKNITTNYQGTSSAMLYTIKPMATLSATIRIPNGPQCSGPVKPIQAALRYPITEDTSVTFHNSGKETFTINSCEKIADITKVDISTFSATTLP